MIKKLFKLIKKLSSTPEEYGRSIGVHIGKNCSIMTKNFGSEPYLITIGDHVQITNDVRFFTHGGGWVLRNEIPDFDSFGKIVVKNNVYIGNCALIMPGVTIGNNVVVGAGSIVTKSIPDNSIVAGVPAKVVSSFDEYKANLLRYNVKSKAMNYDQKKEYLLSLEEELFIKK